MDSVFNDQAAREKKLQVDEMERQIREGNYTQKVNNPNEQREPAPAKGTRAETEAV